jgi:cytoskeletal protein CcmA (bactofilin family)
MKFGNKTDENQVNNITSNNIVTGNQNSVIAEDTAIEGIINSDMEIIIQGKITGKIFSKNKVTVDETGSINGEINAEFITVAGKVDGSLNASNSTILSSRAVIKGDISTKILIIDEGALFSGKCKMVE